uniref:Uncharacterized protein n=1 Tax=Acrobeloides nanus TaxID=290746 RepID=A0A914CRI1_9BILA
MDNSKNQISDREQDKNVYMQDIDLDIDRMRAEGGWRYVEDADEELINLNDQPSTEDKPRGKLVPREKISPKGNSTSEEKSVLEGKPVSKGKPAQPRYGVYSG